MSIDVTILMPCLNEETALPFALKTAKAAVHELEKLGFTSEIVLSDNGSTDNSINIAMQNGCRVVRCPAKGYGNALIYGSNCALGKYIVMGDADGSYDFCESISMVQKLHEGYEVCMGSRFKGKIVPKAMPWMNRYIGNPVLTGILNLFYRSGCSDAHSGLRAFSKNAWHKMDLRCGGMEFASEMVVKSALLGLRITEVPVTLHPDKRGRKPHLNPWRDGWRHLKYLLAFSPTFVFWIPGMLSLLFGIILFVGLLVVQPGTMWHPANLWFGDHWGILAGGLMVGGYEAILLGVVTSAFNQLHLICQDSWFTRMINRHFSFEKSIAAAAVFSIIGAIILIGVVIDWKTKNYANLNRVREVSLATTMFLFASQTLFGGFVVSIIGEKRVRILPNVELVEPSENSSSPICSIAS